MLEIFLKTVPFFSLIAVGYVAARTRFFSPQATEHLTKFVFYFALSAMLFRFAANLSLAEVFDASLAAGYLAATASVYLLVTLVAYFRGLDVKTAAVEAQCGAIGNTGFLGVPMLAVLLGRAAVGPVLLVLAVDLVIFSSLITILITGSGGGVSLSSLRAAASGLVRNPMIVAITLGFVWSGLEFPMPAAMNEFLGILGAAATPGALFAIGASLATKTAERLSVAIWLSFCKLVLHPAFVAIAVFLVFPADPYKAGVVIAAAALPVAGNVFILAQHYGVAPQRVSAAILVSTAASIVTVTAVIAQLPGQ